ncbi:isoaspartyl peptidase/L-asparaginase [Massilia pseudoviolaceinigra]|uniref:isoaspartyl peptidase/L-asparaginase n=1 Tax=Massilia pseudoviolaceinigra TaxID=3057165 RepID=UPI0027964167|nr:isoaspartyl peptidase/L-asparaginase [Massilia sp. CCM 9206]MDQ1924820.1 isoaspartyl peptidase/L-asparaginase [Massilia sp. CCM 9206]
MNSINTGSAIVVHGGAGAGRDLDYGCVQAALAAREQLDQDGDALDAAIAAVLALENDSRFNAGTGAALGLDGTTIEMDACVMDTRGRLGAVAGLRAVKNPVLVARDVSRTPHCLLSGEGAERFARAMGHAPYREVSDKARRAHKKMIDQLAGDGQAMPGADNNDFARFWNYACSPAFAAKSGCDTVGAVVRDQDGHFAVAGSTGGSAPSLLGRVGDTPIIGSGFYAGPHGAVAATGIGEHIMRHMLASTVYHWIASGTALDEALRRGVGLFPDDVSVGLIAVSRTDAGAFSNAPMPQAEVSHG